MSRKNRKKSSNRHLSTIVNNDKLKSNNSTTSIKRDGWSNIMTGIGANTSRVNTTSYGFVPRLDRQTLTNIYTTDCIARQLVNIIVDDAIRGFINADCKLLDELNRVNFKQKLTDAATWARLYGGAALVAFADDGQDMEQEINLDNLKKIVSVQIYDRYQLSFLSTDINQDFYSEHYGHPEVYSITPNNGIPFRVHRSRMHLFGGTRIPNQQYEINNRWDDSVLQALYEPLRNFGQTMNASAEIVQDFVQTVVGINGLAELIASGNDDVVTQRLNVIDYTRSVANTILLDSEHETYSKHASSVAGLSDLIEKEQERLCAGEGIPMSKLFGTHNRGLGSSDNNAPDNWNNNVDAYRGDTLEPAINWFLDLVEAQKTWLDKPESLDWTFPPLKVSNEHEVAKNRLLAAQMDQLYVGMGAIDPEFLFKKRYSDGGFQTDIFISEEEFEEIQGQDDIDSLEEAEAENNLKEVKELKTQLALEEKTIKNIDVSAEEKATQKLVNEKLLELMSTISEK